jgi:hypothetical protein
MANKGATGRLIINCRVGSRITCPNLPHFLQALLGAPPFESFGYHFHRNRRAKPGQADAYGRFFNALANLASARRDGHF